MQYSILVLLLAGMLLAGCGQDVQAEEKDIEIIEEQPEKEVYGK